MILQMDLDSSEVMNRYFDVNPTTVLGLLVGGMAVVILYLVWENRTLKNRVEELTEKLIDLTTTLVEKLSEIKTGIEKHSNNVENKVENLIRWIKSALPKRE